MQVCQKKVLPKTYEETFLLHERILQRIEELEDELRDPELIEMFQSKSRYSSWCQQANTLLKFYYEFLDDLKEHIVTLSNPLFPEEKALIAE